MSLFEINPSKLLTITSLSDSTFPAIQSTDNKPTPFVSPRTVAYIHALLIDTVSAHHSDSPYAQALQNETLVREELQKLDPVEFRNDLCACLTIHYEGILKKEGASGLPLAVTFKRKFSKKCRRRPWLRGSGRGCSSRGGRSRGGRR